MRQTDRDGRNEDRGIGAGERQLEESQRDVDKNVPHMPRHWQGQGTRGEEEGGHPPGPDNREPGRANQYGEAGQVAKEQLHKGLTEHGETPAPQTRDNDQLSKRPGETRDDLPTPRPGDPHADRKN
jgi:hypothetical protein